MREFKRKRLRGDYASAKDCLNASNPSVVSSIKALLPLCVGQLYTLWLLINARTSLFQIMLMNATEIWLALLAAMIFLSPNLKVFGQRAKSQIAYTAALFVVLVFLRFTVIPSSDDATLTWGALTHGLIYLGVTLGLSIVAAFVSGNAGRWWYANMIMPAATVLVAMFFSALAGYFLAGTFGVENAAGPAWGIGLLAAFSAMRVFFIWIYQSRTTPEEMEQNYATFADGPE